MIKVQVFEHEGRLTGFEVQGHSNLAEAGKDIICAGVSALAESALLGIGKHLERQVKYEVKRGNLFMHLEEEPDELTEAILRTMLLGLEGMAKSYPKAIKIQEIAR